MENDIDINPIMATKGLLTPKTWLNRVRNFSPVLLKRIDDAREIRNVLDMVKVLDYCRQWILACETVAKWVRETEETIEAKERECAQLRAEKIHLEAIIKGKLEHGLMRPVDVGPDRVIDPRERKRKRELGG